MSKTIAFDFDGVIHEYLSGWYGEGVVADRPIDSVVKAIYQLRQNGYKVVVYTARSLSEEGHKAVIVTGKQIGRAHV